MLVLLLLACLVYLGFLKFIKPVIYWKKKNIFYVTPWKGFLRSLFGEKSFFELILEAYRRFPEKRYYGSYQFLNPSLFVTDLDLIKQITVKDFEYFPDHFSFVNRKSDPILGQNLFALEGEQWKDMRSTLSPAFTSSKMKAMYTLIQDTAESFTEHFYNQSEKSTVELEMKETYSKFTNDIIATCAFGVQCNSLRNDKNDFFLMGSRITKPTGFNVIKGILAAFFPHIFEFFRIPIFPTFVTKFFQDLIKETISVREKNNIVRPDMIHLLMEARKGRLQHENVTSSDQDVGFATVEESSLGKSVTKMQLTDDLITAQALVFFFAGFDTSSTLLSFMSYHLAIDQNIQIKLQKEIDSVTNLGKGKVSYETLLKMKYLDQVVSETLRRYPPGFLLTRICVKDYKIESKRRDEIDFVLDKGTLVGIPVAGIHLDPKYFPEPEKFNPNRFSEENKVNIVPGSFLPFGSGPRNCIGSRFALLECKTLMVSLLSKFDIVVIKKTPFPLRLSKTFNLAGKDGIWLGLKKRKSY